MATTIDTKPVLELTEDQFFQIWAHNGGMRLMCNADGEIVLIPSEASMMEADVTPFTDMTEDQFFVFCQRTHDVRIERNAEGEILIMPPAGGATGNRNADLTTQLYLWTKRDGTGIAFDSSIGFHLPNTAILSPDASWVLRWRYDELTNREQERFLPLCPDFAIELKSPSDRLPVLKKKMEEYIDNGMKLGWLIAPEQKTVYIYRPRISVEILENPNTVSADPVLPGFVLDLSDIW